jgi:hypothetical protein
VAWVRAVVCAAALALTSTAAASTTRTFARIIPPDEMFLCCSMP